MSKRAIILAGGLGTRLKPYTVVLPKPLMPLGNYSIVELVIRQLAENGFDHITMAVNHQVELIKAFFGDGSRWGVKIDYSLEKMPLGTMGPLKLISDLPDNFLVMNGDVLTDVNFSKIFDSHEANNNLFTIASTERVQQSLYGVLEINSDSKLGGFKEKPSITHDISMGIYIVSSKVLEYIPDNVSYGFDQLMISLIEKNKPASVIKHNGYWLDIGNPDDYSEAIEVFEESPKKFVKSL